MITKDYKLHYSEVLGFTATTQVHLTTLKGVAASMNPNQSTWMCGLIWALAFDMAWEPPLHFVQHIFFARGFYLYKLLYLP